MQKRPWTYSEVGRVAALRAAGWKAAQIAAELDRTVCSVECLVRRQQLAEQIPRMERILPFVQKPHSLATVAAMFGLPIRTIQTYKFRLKRLGYRLYKSSRPGRKQLLEFV